MPSKPPVKSPRDKLIRKMNLHPDDRANYCKVFRIAFFVAWKFKLPLRWVEPKRRPLSTCASGLCYVEEGRVSLVFRWKRRAEFGGTWWSEPREMEGVIGTLAHELAHLRERGHGPEFKALEQEIRPACFEAWEHFRTLALNLMI